MPESIVWHAFGTSFKDEKKHYDTFVVRYYGCRNYIVTVIKNANLFHVCTMGLVQVISFLFLSSMFLIRGKAKDALYIVRALGSIAGDCVAIWRKRLYVQRKIRRVSDGEYFSLVLRDQPVASFVHKAVCYITGRHH